MSALSTVRSAPAPAPEAAPEAGWPSPQAVAEVAARLRALPPLVALGDCLELRRRLAEVAAGRAHLVQGGDCAELFAEVSAHTTRRKAAQLRELAALVEDGTGRPAVAVGRIAGQFAKPRSQPVETGPLGESLPVYRGDAVNGVTPTAEARTPDPGRLLTAYELASDIHRHLAAETEGTGRRVWTSHEALLLDYELPLARTLGDRQYGSSGHLLWIGERTRQPDGRHVRALAELANPVAVKLGPTTTAADVADLVARLDPGREPGRLSFVLRCGADRVEQVLPGLVRAAADAGVRPVWICDPMHGNTERCADGRKTRRMTRVTAEIRSFVRVLRRLGEHPGGVHLELTPDDVTECVAGPGDSPGPSRYWTACDPRLSPDQARAATAAFIEEAR
ncbi:3-deoxy-7-phosphoheptulonate synthase [Kitasatospora sp. NPDC094015]|uniref:3-deoxy-7-phosphoheptulonate synthase n=1 Tax=Kitasatospora sp. NPDC094015 TaxID=3155205 RepID=UPI00331D7565